MLYVNHETFSTAEAEHCAFSHLVKHHFSVVITFFERISLAILNITNKQQPKKNVSLVEHVTIPLKMTRKMERQPIWEASSRPLYPKCVWVEGAGYRHFILDHDINKKRKNYQSSATRKAISCDVIEDDMETLKLDCMSDIKNERRLSIGSDEIDVRNCRRFMRQNRNNLNLIKKQLSNQMSIRECQKQQSECGVDALNKEKSEDTDDINFRKNQLTERVLNWLDLAGRNTLVKPESETGNKKLSKRRVFTTESMKKPTLATNQPPVVRRSDSIHHLSLTFNEDDSYLSQTRSNPYMMDKEKPINFGDLFTTTYRCSRKFLASRQQGVQPKITSAASSKADRYVESEKTKRNRSKKEEYKGIEIQYRAMIQRQILENSCNTQFAKRQLHIFMPNLPKKKLVFPNSADDCESTLSTAMSSQFSNFK